MTKVRPRNALARAGTFSRFIAQQRRERPRIGAELGTPGAGVRLDGSETAWTDSGVRVTTGETFRVAATGAAWLSAPLALGFEPRTALWVRIGGTMQVARPVENDWVFTAWASGPVELMIKGLSEWADAGGALLPGKRPKLGAGIAAEVVRGGAAVAQVVPDDWSYLWRIGNARQVSEAGGELTVSTRGDVGILCRDVDVPLTATTRLDWQWCVDALPSALPEDLAMTHDYLSIAAEFDNGQDLTYMWSAGLAEGHVFACPLDWWCDRETHWVLRSGAAGLGDWHSESRGLAADYAHAIGGDLPTKVTRVWLIANSVFQRREGRARFRAIDVAS